MPEPASRDDTVTAAVRTSFEPSPSGVAWACQWWPHEARVRGVRNAAVWVKSGMALGIGEDIKAEISPRADKRYSTYVYYQMLMGSARLEEVKVVQLKCDLTKTN